MRSARLASAAPLAAFLALGCTAVGPDYEAPQAAVPTSFREDAPAFAKRPADLRLWWQQLGDTMLDTLIERATRDNLDLRESLARIAEARALRGVAAADQWPTVGFDASYERLQPSENTPFGAFAIDQNRWFLGFDASWEIDLWGRVRRSVEAADAELAATVENTNAVAVTVAAETARNYVLLRAAQQRLAIARDNLQLQEQTMALVRARYEAGLVGERDLAQAASNLATTRSRVPAIDTELRTTENRLTVLLGLAPGTLAAELAAVAPIPAPPAEVAVGVPADLVRRRPDVRAAERALAAETARIGVAEGELYPQLTLGGRIGLESNPFDKLFTNDSTVYGIGPALRWNVFDAGRLRNRVRAQGARAQQALLRWERTVLLGLEEAENAMAAFVREQTRREHLATAAAEARRAVEFAQTQYTEGLTDFQNVLDSQRILAEVEDQLAQSSAAITTSLIALYKALGGGIEVAPAEPAAGGASADDTAADAARR